jgi:hypothetical protein
VAGRWILLSLVAVVFAVVGGTVQWWTARDAPSLRDGPHAPWSEPVFFDPRVMDITWNVVVDHDRPVDAARHYHADDVTGLTIQSDGAVLIITICNDKIGEAYGGEGRVAILPTGTTMMLCPDDVEAEVGRFVDTVASLDGYRFEEDGTLVFLRGGDAVLRTAALAGAIVGGD